MSSGWDVEAFRIEHYGGRGKHEHLHVSSPYGRRLEISESAERTGAAGVRRRDRVEGGRGWLTRTR